MKLLSILLLSIAIISCGNSKETSNSTSTAENEAKEDKPSAKMAILSQNIGKFRDSQPYSILDIALNGNILQLNITYSGGCQDHEFELVGSAFIMKSSPPKRIIQLYHHENTDECRELVHDILFFDISDFAYQNSEIILQLQNYKETFRYIKVADE